MSRRGSDAGAAGHARAASDAATGERFCNAVAATSSAVPSRSIRASRCSRSPCRSRSVSHALAQWIARSERCSTASGQDSTATTTAPRSAPATSIG